MSTTAAHTKPVNSEREQALSFLHDVLKPGDTVYTILRHVSASGMTRRISVIVLKLDDKGVARPIHLDWHIEQLGIAKRHARADGLVVGGCGMDMGYHLVYRLGNAMWPNGTDKPHGRRNGKPDSDGGYALEHRWL